VHIQTGHLISKKGISQQTGVVFNFQNKHHRLSTSLPNTFMAHFTLRVWDGYTG